jgi:tricorn protease
LLFLSVQGLSMTRFLGTLLAAFALLAPSGRAQEPIRMARTPDLSPDGKLIAFSYLGDIWTVEAIGGVARPVTQHVAHDINPIFSPDGRSLAFASNRHGSYDVFVVPVRGGRPRRLTSDSANDIPTGWSPDGKHILFTSTRSPSFPPQSELYSVPVEGGRARRITTAEGREGVYSPRGDRIAYVRGPGAWYRRNYRGSSNNDIWLCNADGHNNRQLTTFNGQDGSPMWAPDGRTLFYVSEVFGTANVVKQDMDSTGSAPVLVTADKNGKPFHTETRVRQARISGNGEWIVYECGADLWITSTKPGATPRRLAIEAYADDKTNPERTVTFTSRATEYALSRDERYVAFAVHGELFLMPVGSRSEVRRLTDHPANDHGIAWSPDSSKIVFISDRNGYEDLYLLEADDPEHPRFTQAHQFKVKQLTNTREAESAVQFSPDGQRVTFLRSGRLWSMKPDGSDQKVIVDTPQVIDYEWSPDSKWIVYSRMDGSFASELYIMRANGGEAKNVTRFATFNAGVTWSDDGKKLCFLSNRKGSTGVYVLSLQKESAPGAASSDDIDWEDIHHRVTQPTTMETHEAAISKDGSRVAFVATVQNRTELWVASTNGESVTRVTTGNLRPRQIQWSRRLPSLLYFRDGNGQIHIARIPSGPISPPSSSSEPGMANSSLYAVIPFKAKMTIKDDELHKEMFEQSWRSLYDYFYDPKLHGVDWEAVRARYKPLVEHVATKEDLYALLYMMMGELNASHLGVGGFITAPEQMTAELGLLFDEAYTGRGLKITEVLKRGPADRRGISLKAGEYILAIDGTELTPTSEVSSLLNDKVGETVALLVSADPKASLKDRRAVRRVELKAIRRNTDPRRPDEVSAENLLYERWVENNARRVAELSKGKLGYIHIPSMNEEGLERFVRSLYSDNFDKEALVLDVRYNGGGFTHEQVLNYLGSREHTFFRHRFGGEGLVLRAYDRKWTKPAVLLINNRSYSDAEIFPHAFRTLGLGKLVGQSTGGFVIGTGSISLIDGSTFRVPRIGVFTVQGTNMEKEGVKPDVEVVPHPDQLARGSDAQLDKAAEVLQVEVAKWKKTRPSVTAREDSTPRPAPVVPLPLPVTPGPMPPAGK